MLTEAEFQFAIEVHEKVAHIDLNRPEEGNRLTRSMIAELARLIRQCGARDDVHVIVLRSRGDAFCRGRDGRGETSKGLTSYEIRQRMMGPVLSVYSAISEVACPVIARVHADAIGFGAAVAGGCDIALASSEAAFAFPEIEHDIAPTMAMSAVINKLPPAILSYLIYSGQRITSAEALQYGLIGKVYPSVDFETSFDAFIGKLATRPKQILETIKKYQAEAANLPQRLRFDYAGDLLALVRAQGK